MAADALIVRVFNLVKSLYSELKRILLKVYTHFEWFQWYILIVCQEYDTLSTHCLSTTAAWAGSRQCPPPVPIGRAAKAKRTHEHGYSRNIKKKRKVPNSLAYAIENDQAVGKTHSTKWVIFVIFFCLYAHTQRLNYLYICILSICMYIGSSNAVCEQIR